MSQSVGRMDTALNMQLELVFTKRRTIQMQCHLRNVQDHTSVTFGRMSQVKESPISLVSRFAHGRVINHNSKFGLHFKSYNYPINAITIDEFSVVHGWLVILMSSKNRHSREELQDFADMMRGTMKVHIALIKTMKSPEIIDLN